MLAPGTDPNRSAQPPINPAIEETTTAIPEPTDG
ncbi:unnamed protein product, partial [marine sediment metagenome]